MNRIVIILSLLILLSCSKQETDISGTWLNSDFTFPTILEFTNSQWIDHIFWADTINYCIKNDSIFILNLSGQKEIGFKYKISGDSLWTSFPGDLQTEETLYFKSKGNNFIDDIKTSFGISLDLPKGNTCIVGNHFGFSIYFPKQSLSKTDKYVFLNNKKVKLDTLLHEKIFSLYELNEYLRFNMVGLYIDSSIKYDQLRLLFDELRKVQIYKVALVSSTKPDDLYPKNTGIIRKLPPIYDFENYYINPLISKSINNRRLKSPPYNNPIKSLNKDSKICNIKITDNKILLNEKEFNFNDYFDLVLQSNPHTTFVNIDNKSDYQTYHSFLQLTDSLVKLKKNKISQDLYNQEYEMLISEERIKNVNRMVKHGLIEK